MTTGRVGAVHPAGDADDLETCLDALGRYVEVDEPKSRGRSTGICETEVRLAGSVVKLQHRGRFAMRGDLHRAARHRWQHVGQGPGGRLCAVDRQYLQAVVWAHSVQSAGHCQHADHSHGYHPNSHLLSLL